MKIKLGTRIKHLVGSDLPAIMTIEKESHPSECCWSPNDFRGFLSHMFYTGIGVFSSQGELLGFAFFKVDEGCFLLLNLAVRKGYRRQGVGREMIDWLIDKCQGTQFKRIETHVRLDNHVGRVFLVSCGFRIMRLTNNFYPDGQDAFDMRYLLLQDCRL